MGKSILKGLIISKFSVFLCFVFFILFLFLYENPCNRLINNNIKNGFRGVILEKIAVRDGIISHAKIKLNKKDTIIFLNNLSDVITGDSIIKPNNSPFYFYKKNGIWYKQTFEIISKDLQKSKCFPEEWKKKCGAEWKEACL